jgi:hypothetical protein
MMRGCRRGRPVFTDRDHTARDERCAASYFIGIAGPGYSAAAARYRADLRQFERTEQTSNGTQQEEE